MILLNLWMILILKNYLGTMERREIKIRCESEFEERVQVRRVDYKLARVVTRGCV
jgi:hypothetical protein